jgi:hypothetical protein
MSYETELGASHDCFMAATVQCKVKDTTSHC